MQEGNTRKHALLLFRIPLTVGKRAISPMGISGFDDDFSLAAAAESATLRSLRNSRAVGLKVIARKAVLKPDKMREPR